MQVQDAASTRVGKNVDRALCYGPSDFRVGGVVPIFGRDLYVHDCDQFTRDWYKVRRLHLLLFTASQLICGMVLRVWSLPDVWHVLVNAMVTRAQMPAARRCCM